MIETKEKKMKFILKSTFAIKSFYLRSHTMEAHAEHLNQILSGSNKQIKMQKIDASKKWSASMKHTMTLVCKFLQKNWQSTISCFEINNVEALATIFLTQ